MISIQQALDFILPATKSFGSEEVSIDNALGRIASEDIYADRDYPPFNRSAMDGYAVVAGDLAQTSVNLNIIERLFAGSVAKQKVISGSCIKIMTGAPVPEGADAVIRVEDCVESGDTVQFNTDNVRPQKNIAAQGEDAKKGDLVIAKNTRLSAHDVAVLAVTGKATVQVAKHPNVLVVSTGNEIVSVGDPILPHQIRDSNAHFLKNMFKSYAINSVKTALVADDKAQLEQVIKMGLSTDILILSGGVSKGDADYVPEVLTSLGVKEVFHRVQVKPGAPLWFGTTPSGGVVFGLPGNPVAVQVAFKVFIEPFLRKCFGLEATQPMYLPILHDKKKKSKFTEFFPCKLSNTNTTTGLVSTTMNGSGDISATLNSDGLAIHPAEQEVLKENEKLAFYPWNAYN